MAEGQPVIDPPKEKKVDPEPSAPLWMITMGDMNTLLMTFFIILFSMLTDERDRYIRIHTEPSHQSLTDFSANKAALDAEPNESMIFSGWFRGVTQKPAQQAKIRIEQRVEVQITTTPGGTVITIGGNADKYNVGEWEMTNDQKLILKEILKWMSSKENRIIIRGFTSGDLWDSVVREGQTIRKYSQEDYDSDEAREVADHWLLSSLRAREVRRYFTEGIYMIPEGKIGQKGAEEVHYKIDPGRIEVQLEAYNDSVARDDIISERYKNRRVEVVILPYK